MSGDAALARTGASALARADALLCRLEEGFIALALAFAGCLLFVNVIGRYVFHAPISWAEEVSLYLIVWMVFIGASVAIRTRGHIAMDLLPLALSRKNRSRLAIFTGLIVLIFLVVFFFFSAEHTLRIRASGQLTPVMQAPMWLTYLAMPVGSVLMFIRMTQVLWRALQNQYEPSVDLQD
jgi:TRAP-type C4-dicarboxylate transport system permease small subunit